MSWKPIPGETPIDISDLKIKGIANREQLNYFEFQNLRKAYRKYLVGTITRRSAKFNLSWTKKLHKEMFGDVWKWAGEFRKKDGYNLGASWIHIETKLQILLDDLTFWKEQGLDFVEQAAMLHHRAVFIHPFPNGNGRWSRMLANIWLRLHKQPIVAWPEETIGNQESQIRTDYLKAIKSADEGEYRPLIELHRQFMEVPSGWFGTESQGGLPAPQTGERGNSWLFGTTITEPFLPGAGQSEPQANPTAKQPHPEDQPGGE